MHGWDCYTMFKMIMNGYLGGMTKAAFQSLTFIHLYTDVNTCSELTGPPTDPDGNNMEYFCRTKKGIFLQDQERNIFAGSRKYR